MRLLFLCALLAATLAGCADEDGDDDHDGMDHGDGTGTHSMSGTSTTAPTTAPSEPAPAPQTHASVMRSNRFEPADLTIRVGDTVRWTTEDVQAHNVVSTTPGSEFRSEDVSPLPVVHQQEFSYTFTSDGFVQYVCEYHDGMVGTILVTDDD